MKFSITCDQIAKVTGGTIKGIADCNIEGINRIQDARKGELAFYADEKYVDFLEATEASCVLVPSDYDGKVPAGKSYIFLDDPHRGFVQILMYLDNSVPKLRSEIHPTAVIDSNAKISPTAWIGAYCVIGAECQISDNVVIHPNTVLYNNVIIGENSLIHSGVICREETVIGKNCVIHAGTILGSDGFGYAEKEDGSYIKIPQLGNVVLQDDVEIGANTCIDRAIAGSTIVEQGCKFDNLVQIGHNAVIGKNTGIVAQAGVAGSTKLGQRNRIGGQVGFAGHIDTADDVTILAQSGVAKSVDKAGFYFGSPIKDRRSAFRIEAVLNKLPDMYFDMKKIKDDIEKLKKD